MSTVTGDEWVVKATDTTGQVSYVWEHGTTCTLVKDRNKATVYSNKMAAQCALVYLHGWQCAVEAK